MAVIWTTRGLWTQTARSFWLSVCMHVRVCTCVCAWLPACLLSPRWAGDSLFIFINLSECTHPLSLVSVSVCLSVCQPWHPVSWSATNPLSSLPKIWLVSKNNNMLSVDHAFCDRLYLCDFNRSREVVQTFNRTSLSDRAAYRVWDFGNPVKIQGRAQKYHLPAPIVTRKKIIEQCYL